MMKLWILRPANKSAEGSPWDPWYDKVFGFVVRAETEAQAREFATAEAADEDPTWKGEEGRTHCWMKPELSTCKELTPDGEAGIVMEDHRAA